MKNNIKDLVINASVAAIYIVLTLVFASFSFGPIQFRIAEALVLLCFFNKKYILPLTVACLISNLMSPFGLYDVIFGTTATLLSLIFISKSKNLMVASLFPVLFNGVIVSLEISLINGIFELEVFLFNFLTIAIGEFVCVSVFGVILFSFLKKNNEFLKLLNNNEK
jgi:uncharacterized membrane protein